ncbi:MAG: multiprotein bridging factor aMBF1 [Candidatus Bathyarchaeota archaeon]|nr:multiprotein bridging factor aMBF1 [Candidatus Bathyarchaeota archaeon]
MRCEVCGKPIQGKQYSIIIEGAKLITCEECSGYGSPVTLEKPVKKAEVKPQTTKRAGETQTDLDEDLILVENYGLRIKNVREKLGWSQEELALKMNEKASFISKIETGKVVPDLATIKRLEHVLKIRLTTKAPKPLKVEEFKPKPDEKLTIGDIVSISLGEGKGRKGGKSESSSGGA